jgi:hypothetical protein
MWTRAPQPASPLDLYDLTISNCGTRKPVGTFRRSFQPLSPPDRVICVIRIDELMHLMECEAIEDANDRDTGYSGGRGGVKTRFFPALRRHYWLDETGTITKRLAVKKLTTWLSSRKDPSAA